MNKLVSSVQSRHVCGVLLTVVLMGLLPYVHADGQPKKATASTTATSLSPADAQQAEAGRQQRLIQGAEQVVLMVDRGQSGDIWEGLSIPIRGMVRKSDFISQIQSKRQGLGNPVQRHVITTNQQSITGQKSIPDGLYYTVFVEAKFSGGQTVRELISFRHDEDNVWRVAGYTIQ